MEIQPIGNGILIQTAGGLSSSTVGGFGGGIDNRGVLTHYQQHRLGEFGLELGGGIYTGGSLSSDIIIEDVLNLTNSTVSGNSADFGGGIANANRAR